MGPWQRRHGLDHLLHRRDLDRQQPGLEHLCQELLEHHLCQELLEHHLCRVRQEQLDQRRLFPEGVDLHLHDREEEDRRHHGLGQRELLLCREEVGHRHHGLEGVGRHRHVLGEQERRLYLVGVGLRRRVLGEQERLLVREGAGHQLLCQEAEDQMGQPGQEALLCLYHWRQAPELVQIHLDQGVQGDHLCLSQQ